MSDLIKAVKGTFGGKRIVIAGDLVADQFLSGSISRVSREAPVFILKHQNTQTRPGGAANAAANVASLGGTPLLIGVIGDDENGDALRDSLDKSGVSTHLVKTNSGGITTTKVRVLAGQHYSAKQQVIRIDYENDALFDNVIRRHLIDKLRSAAADANAIVVSDYGYGVVDEELYAEALRLSTELSIPLVVDSRFRLPKFTGATSATPNQEEVENILGAGFADTDCSNLCRELGYRSLLVTCGNKGMSLYEGGRDAVMIPAIGPAEPVDVTGAGDTVIAAYSLGLAAGLSFRDAAMIANHAGGIVVMKKATATASRDELLNSLTNDAIPISASDRAA
jgi:rfaE bifunctional protein kinase chain/domain